MKRVVVLLLSSVLLDPVNRDYKKLGHFIQKDPHQTALIMEELLRKGLR